MNPHFFTAPFYFAFIWFMVHGSWFRWRLRRLFLLGDARKWHLSHQSLVTSHSYDTREGIISHAWYEILRLSPHLFWLFFSHIGRFSPLGMTVLGERMVSRGGGIAAFLEEGILVSTT